MLTTALTAVLGSIAGCLATLQVERVKARRSEAGKAEERERAEKRAFRLAERELDTVAHRIANAAAARHYLGLEWHSLTAEWGQQRSALAGALGTADWFRVLAAYDAIEDLQALLEQRLSPHDEPETAGHAITQALMSARYGRVREGDQLQLRWRAVRTAAWILRSYSGDAEDVERALRDDEEIARKLWGPSPERLSA